jgi:hypothetical protein
VVERLRIEVQALPCGVAAGRAASVAWLDVPVRIRLDSEAYEPIDVTWHGSDGPLPALTVQHRLPTAGRD